MSLAVVRSPFPAERIVSRHFACPRWREFYTYHPMWKPVEAPSGRTMMVRALTVRDVRHLSCMEMATDGMSEIARAFILQRGVKGTCAAADASFLMKMVYRVTFTNGYVGEVAPAHFQRDVSMLTNAINGLSVLHGFTFDAVQNLEFWRFAMIDPTKVLFI